MDKKLGAIGSYRSKNDLPISLFSWEPPQPDAIKRNFDRAWSTGAGMGFAIRDLRGRLVVAGEGRSEASSPTLAELFAAGWAIN